MTNLKIYAGIYNEKQTLVETIGNSNKTWSLKKFWKTIIKSPLLIYSLLPIVYTTSLFPSISLAQLLKIAASTLFLEGTFILGTMVLLKKDIVRKKQEAIKRLETVSLTLEKENVYATALDLKKALVISNSDREPYGKTYNIKRTNYIILGDYNCHIIKEELTHRDGALVGSRLDLLEPDDFSSLGEEEKVKGYCIYGRK